MKTHELKTWPEFYGPVARREKTFEVRKDDRGFEVGDILILREWSPEDGYSGDRLTRCVTYILRDCLHVARGYCVMGIS